MQFGRLQALGEEKFTKIVNLLVRGEPALRLARQIQQPPPDGWGQFQEVAEKTLTQQLLRLRIAAAEGFFGKKAAQSIAEGNTPQVRLLKNVSVRVLDRMEELADWQRTRAEKLMGKEAEALLPNISNKMAPQEYRHILTQTNAVFSDYRQTLLDLQEIRFKLGLDEFKGPVTGVARGVSQTTTFPDGTSVQKQVFEAVKSVESIFDRRMIPQQVGP